MITFPAIIKHADDDELVYVSDQASWDNDADLHFFDYHETDYLVDVTGNVFTLMTRENQLVIPQLTGKTLALEEVLGLVKAHAAQKGSCCVAKMYAPSIIEAFKIVASMED